MRTSYAIIISLGICIVAAVLEGACAGKNVKAYFATLRSPLFAAPLWVWYIIGVIYYAIFLFILFRILKLVTDSPLKPSVLGLIVFMMALNAAWNYVFFRAHKLFVAFVVASLFPILDVALFICLLLLDSVAAWTLIPYLLYRVYALWWGYGLWKLNRHKLVPIDE